MNQKLPELNLLTILLNYDQAQACLPTSLTPMSATQDLLHLTYVDKLIFNF